MRVVSGHPIKDISGLRFGRLVALGRLNSKTGRCFNWKCRCDCGAVISASGASLRRGRKRSCGCLHRDSTILRNKTHGMSKSTTFCIWNQMIQRCTNPNSRNYRNYGKRGISVCEKWLTFSNFLADMGPKPRGMSIDRINNDGDYEPGNCRWATRKQQRRNSRSNVFVFLNGQKMTLADACEMVGKDRTKIYRRMRYAGRGFNEALEHG